MTFHYDARFTASLKRVPTGQELAAALEGPAARAAGDYIAALRRRDLPAFSATLTAAAAAGFTGSDGEARFARLAAELPADTRVVSVLTHEDGGTPVTLQGRQDGIVNTSSRPSRKRATGRSAGEPARHRPVRRQFDRLDDAPVIGVIVTLRYQTFS